MIYNIDKTKTEAAYMQLYKLIRNDIIKGVYKYGNKLPSKRSISEESGVSVITAEHTYALLSDEGYIESRERSGYFVIYKKEDFYVPNESNSVIEHSHRIPDNECFSYSLYAKATRVVLSKYGEELLVKSPGTGCYELKKAISDYLLRSRGISVSTEQIVIGAGAEYLYGLIPQILGRDRKFAIEFPSYKRIEEIYTANGVSFDRLRLGKDGILSNELKRTDAEILHVTPYNSYPTLITASASKRHEYINFSKERNAVIIEDDYNSEFSSLSKTEDTLFSLDGEKNVIYLNTFSKTVAPSVRVGYLVLPYQKKAEYLEKIKSYSCTVSVLDQYILAEIINNGSFERHINRIRRKRRKANEENKENNKYI